MPTNPNALAVDSAGADRTWSAADLDTLKKFGTDFGFLRSRRQSADPSLTKREDREITSLPPAPSKPR